MASNVIEFIIKGTATGAIKAMQKVSKTIKDMGKSAMRFSKWALASAAALLAFVKVVNQGIDKTAKFATRLGKAVDELSKMQFVANQAGISTEQFNLATQRMTRRVAEAAEGMGEAQTALIELGISAKDFSKLKLSDQYAKLADRLGSVEDPAKRLRLAFKLFDSEGTSVLQMLNKGSAAMQQIARDAEFLGLVISKQAAANAEHFEDSLGRATGSIKGLSRSIVGELTPVLSGLANAFADFVASNRGAVVNFVKNAVVSFFTFVEVVRQVFARIKEVFNGNEEALSTLLDGIGRFVLAASKLFINLGKALAIGIWEGAKAAILVLIDFGNWLGEYIANIIDNRETKDLSDTLAKAMKERFSKAFEEIKNGIAEPMKEVAKDSADAANALGEAWGVNLDLAREKAKAAIVSISEFGTVVDEQMRNTSEGISEFMQRFQEGQLTFMQQLQDNSRTFVTEFYNLVNSTIDAISTGIGEVIANGANLADTFKQIAKSVLSQLIAIIVKMGIQRLILSSLTKTATQTEAAQSMAKISAETFGNAFASTAAIPIIGPSLAPGVAAASTAIMQAGATAAGASGSALGAAITGARQYGGGVYEGRSYLVGERGPELFTPGTSGSITANDGLSGGVSIGTISISILPNATNADAFFKLSKPELENLVAGPIIEALNRLDRKGIRPVGLERRRR